MLVKKSLVESGLGFTVSTNLFRKHNTEQQEGYSGDVRGKSERLGMFEFKVEDYL